METKCENYVLSEEIDFCLDGLTASKWEKYIEVFLTKGQLPNKVFGDLTRFRMCLRTMLEFGIKYSQDNQMQVKCEFIGITQEREFIISFSVILTKNEAIDTEPLEILLAEPVVDPEEKKMEDLSFEPQIRKMYSQFFGHINDFGFGMIVFPQIVK